MNRFFISFCLLLLSLTIYGCGTEPAKAPTQAPSTSTAPAPPTEKVPVRTSLLIEPGSFRGIQVGAPINAHIDYLVKSEIKNGEGTFSVYTIKDFNNNPAGYVMPDPRDENLVGDITVETKMASTKEGIQVGSTFGDVKKALPEIEVHGSEIEGRTYASYAGIKYRLDIAHFTYEVDASTIPETTPVIEIVIPRK